MTIALSKTLDPADFADLAPELAIVDQHFTSAREQHPMRKWEYALALRAFATWGGQATHRCVDVGGAGSPFWRMVPADNVFVIDPDENVALAQYLGSVAPAPVLAHAVFCLSVLEHVDDLDRFLYHLSCLVAPGGLLVLTVDACGCPSHAADLEVGEPPDPHHFHWMRRRIFGRADLRWLAETLYGYQFSRLGDQDCVYRGPQVFDYSFASLALVKRA